jgi:hypothetical protein
MPHSGRSSSERLLEEYRKVLAAGEDTPLSVPDPHDPDKRIRIARHDEYSCLRDSFFGVVGGIFTHLHQLRDRLPWQPWMARAFGPGIVTLLFGVGVWLYALNARTITAETCNVKQDEKIERVEQRAVARMDSMTAKWEPLMTGLAVTNAKLDMILDSKGQGRPSRSRIARARRELGLPVDSTAHDSD